MTEKQTMYAMAQAAMQSCQSPHPKDVAAVMLEALPKSAHKTRLINQHTTEQERATVRVVSR